MEHWEYDVFDKKCENIRDLYKLHLLLFSRDVTSITPGHYLLTSALYVHYFTVIIEITTGCSALYVHYLTVLIEITTGCPERTTLNLSDPCYTFA